ncbi:sal-like protein 1 isoform X50 [Oncorhynchus keta]|uniref:sal-like protein 1 isoform X50 n=1 Tax=Oncorhynchus keta TaxID=8018 RepID=UPI00227A69ED|nr:sal-like protein 1 isoform X50 [Oncorhynchus keta]
MMSEATVTFQSQLSGVMETVFKAAMYEITRLVDDSFMKEMSRSREQVESLKKRLQWSENRRRDRDREGGRIGKCADCGRANEDKERSSGASQTGVERGRGLKQEKVLGEEWSSCGGVAGETASHDLEEADAISPRRTSEPADVGRQKLDSLLKEEALHNTELQESWGVCLDGADGSDVSGPSKSFSEQELQQCQDDWGSGLDRDPEPSGPDGDSVDPTDPLYRPRYSMEELGDGFEKSGYGSSGSGAHLLDMEGLDRLPGSPSRLGELSYGAAGHYQVDLGGSEGGDHHHRSHTPGSHRSQREQVRSPMSSPHPEVGDLNCLLINEEGYPEHGVPDSGSRAGHRGLTSIHSGSSAHNNNTESLYDAADDFGLSLNLRNRSQEQVTGGGRCHACNQCSMTFPDSGSLKAHKQKHKTGRWLNSGPGTPYSRTQCSKTFTQACNIKVQAEGRHLCSQCGKGFTSFSDLKRHTCSQTADKPYCCSLCGNKFSRLWNLKLHRRIHTQEKPHRCTMCEKSFTRADILKVHKRTHTGERPYCCAVCGLRFKQLNHLKSHQHKHRPDLLSRVVV